MPDIRVQDSQGTVHVFPDGSTPEMIAKAMGVKPPAANADDSAAITKMHQIGIAYDPQNPPQQDWAKGLSPKQYLDMQQKGSSLEFPGQMLGGMAAAPAAAALKVGSEAPWLMKLLGLGARSAVAGGGIAAGEAAAGGSPGGIETAAETGALAQPVGEAVSAVASKMAPKIAESALNITNKMRGRGRTIGDVVLEQTTGVKPSTLSPEIKGVIDKLSGQLETQVDAATSAGRVGSAQGAKDALNEALEGLPRNAKSLNAKLSGMKDLFDLGNGIQTTYTPTELLEMKRGIGIEIGTWPAEFKASPPIKALQERMYGALDSEIDRLAPGTDKINQQISSLIPAKYQSLAADQGASIGERLLHRMGAHTGAMAPAILGGEVAGMPGSLAALAASEFGNSTLGKMILARLLQSVSQDAVPVASAGAAAISAGRGR